MKRYLKDLKIIVVGIGLLMFIPSCHDQLDEVVYDQLTGEALFSNPDNAIYAFGGAYTNLYDLIGNKYNCGADCGTDLLCVPQRGGDWEDGGEWHRYHRLTWTPNEGYISRSYDLNYLGINAINKLIAGLETIETDAIKIAIAELRGLRAYHYLNLIDQFGNVVINKKFPLEVEFPKNTPRDSVFLFIETELKEAMPLLAKKSGSEYYGRITYYSAQMMLAKLYLNAEVYTGTPKLAEAEEAIDSIMAGPFALETSIFDNYVENATASKEHIFGVPFDQIYAKGFEMHLFTLHYVEAGNYGITSAAWNGLSAQKSLYDLLAQDAADDRLNGLVYGPQVDADGNPLLDAAYEKPKPGSGLPFDKDGASLNHTPEINMLEPLCLRQAGARIKKFNFVEGTGRYMGNDYPIYRYADVLLMKAEVRLRQGDASGALPFVNEVRTRAKATPLTEVTEDNLLDERARELFAEGHRRSDLIRFGKYLDARWEKPEKSPDHVQLWPIPAKALGVNANLVQNPGY
ncbi:MAG: RagB/SusD family nutrient uptake outer membrane protein [Salinivirgaceae bacterium]|jgi:hypothetical protein